MSNARGLAAGRFSKEADPLFREINDSLPFDYRLAKQDIQGSIAWARAIEHARVLTADERARLVGALEELAALVERELNEPLASLARASGSSIVSHEDVHSWVEAKLIERVGDLGKKLHTGRSRNDQVATDLRLWTRDAIGTRLDEVREAQRALLDLAQREQGTPWPGYTHLQPAQPVLLAHWCLAFFEMLDRDASRLRDARARANLCPLGSGALAGTAYPIDRAALAKDLGFDGPTANSLDAVADRDFVVEALAAAALCATHLSRLAEELIIYSTPEFGMVELDDSVTSGSSLMPQKKNPDALELMRGKVGRILGAHVAMLTTLKGLPLAYNKDMQEDKEPLFDAMDSLSLCLRIVPRVLDTIRIDRDGARARAGAGYTNATELADYLVGKGIPFRDAHHHAGQIVRRAIELNVPLARVPLAEMQRVCVKIENDVFAALTLESSLARRNIEGGTGPRAVAQALAAARSRLSPASA
jgi:argininosuccinate lyase